MFSVRRGLVGARLALEGGNVIVVEASSLRPMYSSTSTLREKLFVCRRDVISVASFPGGG